MSDDRELAVRVYLPWLRASVVIKPDDIEGPTKTWIDAANAWQARAIAAEEELVRLKREKE